MVCSYCGSTSMEYLGIEKREWDADLPIAEVWKCENCGLRESHFYTGEPKVDTVTRTSYLADGSEHDV